MEDPLVVIGVVATNFFCGRCGGEKKTTRRKVFFAVRKEGEIEEPHRLILRDDGRLLIAKRESCTGAPLRKYEEESLSLFL